MRKAAPCPLEQRPAFQDHGDAVALQRLVRRLGPCVRQKRRAIGLRNGTGDALLQALQLDGFTVQWLRSMAATPPVPDANEIAAVLLDLTLPDGQGMALLRHWRRAGLAVPVIVITARTALQDRLDGLDAGADDYVLKPFHVPELLSRLHA
eukprot:gene11081-biopygen9718